MYESRRSLRVFRARPLDIISGFMVNTDTAAQQNKKTDFIAGSIAPGTSSSSPCAPNAKRTRAISRRLESCLLASVNWSALCPAGPAVSVACASPASRTRRTASGSSDAIANKRVGRGVAGCTKPSADAARGDVARVGGMWMGAGGIRRRIVLSSSSEFWWSLSPASGVVPHRLSCSGAVSGGLSRSCPGRVVSLSWVVWVLVGIGAECYIILSAHIRRSR